MPEVTESARSLVAQRLVRRVKWFPDLPLDAFDTSSLSPRDAGLANAIDHAVARRWLTMRAVVEHFLSRPWDNTEPHMQAILLSGAAQLLLLDRLPDHAVINESVEWAKRAVRPKAGGMVNAILRKVAGVRDELVDTHDPARRDELPRSDGGAWRLRENVFSDDELTRHAAQLSIPRPLLAHWISALGRDAALQLGRHGLIVPPIIVSGIDDDSIGPAHMQPGFRVYDGVIEDLGRVLAAQPGARVQDPSSAQPVELTRTILPKCIMDVCAGQGTKTSQLARMHPNARIIATDIDDARRKVLRTTFANNDRITIVEPGDLHNHNGQADLLLLDVPCSNTGVLARRVEARYRWREETIDQLVGVQRQIIADTIPLLAPNGHLLYATCSIEPAENAKQTAWIREWHPFTEVAVASRWPSGQPGDAPTTYSDGSYAALLVR